MMPGANMKIDTNIKLPLAFIVYALIAFAAAQLIFLLHHDLLVAGQMRMPDIWMGAHFLLLGFALMVAMGAMYQLVPVAFLTPIWNQTFGFAQFYFTAIGITGFAILLGIKPDSAIYGGIIAVIGVMMFIIQMTITIFKQEKKNKMTLFVAGAIICLSLTIAAGFLLAWNIALGGIASHTKLVLSHIVLGVAGWFTLLIFGFSYKLVPMFSLSHGYSMKWAKASFFSYITGLIVLISSFWLENNTLQTIGWLLLLIGYGLFVLDIADILKKRFKKKLDKPFSFALFAIWIGFSIHVLAVIFRLLGIHDPIIWSWLIFLYIMGWIIFSILGYLYKIVPVLWWTYKYSDRVGKERVPLLKDMINEKLSLVLFSLFIIGVAGLAIGGIVHIEMAVFIFQSLLSLISLVYTISIIRVLFV
ncbi:hypothetical protein [Virgibacillus oceani]